MQIIDIGVHTVEVRDDRGYHSTVTPQNGHWYCMRCDRYRCEHALFVTQENPTLVQVPLTQEEMASIIDDEEVYLTGVDTDGNEWVYLEDIDGPMLFMS